MAAKAKPKKPVSKNHFVKGSDSRISSVGTIRGVSIDKYELRDEKLKLVGDKGGYQNRMEIEGEKLPVYMDDRGLYFIPDCGDAGFAITLETFDALAAEVAANRDK